MAAWWTACEARTMREKHVLIAGAGGGVGRAALEAFQAPRHSALPSACARVTARPFVATVLLAKF